MISKLVEILGNEVDVEEDDRDYSQILLNTLESWIKAARYVKQKKELGDQMMFRKKDFLEGSSLLEDLPIRVITGQVNPEDAKRLFERTNGAPDEWVRAAQSFYEARPTQTKSLKKGLRMLKGEEIKVGTDLDYKKREKNLKGEATPGGDEARKNTDAFLTVRSAAIIHKRTEKLGGF